jgi:hypothetical protein
MKVGSKRSVQQQNGDDHEAISQGASGGKEIVIVVTPLPLDTLRLLLRLASAAPVLQCRQMLQNVVTLPRVVTLSLAQRCRKQATHSGRDALSTTNEYEGLVVATPKFVYPRPDRRH